MQSLILSLPSSFLSLSTHPSFFFFFFFNDPATTEIYTLSLHDALPILDDAEIDGLCGAAVLRVLRHWSHRSEEHTSELQSQFHLVCRLLLEKKKKNKKNIHKHFKQLRNTIIT